MGGETEASVSLCAWKGKGKGKEKEREKGEENGKERTRKRRGKLSDYSLTFNNI